MAQNTSLALLSLPSWFIAFSVDLALAVVVLEAIALSVFRWKTGRGLSIRSVLLIAAAGGGLLMALKAALSGAPVPSILAGLTIGGFAHAIDLVERLRREK
jgi:hypothetical protein